MSSDVLGALKQIKKAISQSRDKGIVTVATMIAAVDAGEDLNPLPEVTPGPRQPMKPMAVRQPKPAPEPEVVPDEDTEPEDTA